MKYARFEDLPVWKAAIKLAIEIYALTSRSEFKGHYSLKDQLERSGLSISNNIAEGFERGTTQEVLTFIYIAKVFTLRKDRQVRFARCCACFNV